MPVNSRLQPEFPAASLRRRRQRLAKLIGNGTALLFSGQRSRRAADTWQPEVNMRYLCGWRQPGALLMLRAARGMLREETLFCPRQHPERVIWDGRQPGIREARANFGLQEALPFTDFGKICTRHLEQEDTVFIDPASCPRLAGQILEFWRTKGAGSNFCMRGLAPLTARLRMIKSAAELARLRRSSALAARAVHRVIGQIRHLESEAQLAAMLGQHYVERGGTHAFSPIVAGGRNACILHYLENDCPLRKRDLVLIDTGCELGGYASDISRTVPVSGRFTPVQRRLYETVLAAQQAALATVRPGSTLQRACQAAQKVMRSRLRRMGIVKPARRSADSGAGGLEEFFMHGIGHHIGMQVHDAVADVGGRERRLEAGMCITIEPGLYFAAGAGIPAPVRNTGIRIEDTVAVVRGGCEILTKAAAKLPDAIEAAMGSC